MVLKNSYNWIALITDKGMTYMIKKKKMINSRMGRTVAALINQMWYYKKIFNGKEKYHDILNFKMVTK